MNSRTYFAALPAIALLVSATASRGDTVDWSTITYEPTPAQSIVNTSITTVSGNTISVDFGNNLYFVNATNNPSYAVPSPGAGTYSTANTATANQVYTNGGTTGAYGLQVVADFDNASGNFISGAAIPVTISFSKPVSNVSYNFYDVDNGTVGGGGTFNGGVYNDEITNIFARTQGGIAVAPLTLTAGVTNTVNGPESLLATANNNQNASGGNASVTFGSTPITSFTFTYTDNAAAGSAHSTLQIIALSNINYSNAPEPSSFLFVGLSLAGGFCVRRFMGTVK